MLMVKSTLSIMTYDNINYDIFFDLIKIIYRMDSTILNIQNLFKKTCRNKFLVKISLPIQTLRLLVAVLSTSTRRFLFSYDCPAI